MMANNIGLFMLVMDLAIRIAGGFYAARALWLYDKGRSIDAIFCMTCAVFCFALLGVTK